MRLLVVGAGASYAECRERNLPDELCMPLMKDLSRKLWADYNPTPFLEAFLEEQGHKATADPMALFYELERSAPGLIEDFFASAWRLRDVFHSPYSRCWDDLLYHGLLRPLNFILIQGLLKDNTQPRFPLAEAVAEKLSPGDVVLSLNYDLIFDVAIKNVRHKAIYSPHSPTAGNIWVFKPHGSFHLAVDEKEGNFWFGQVEFIGDIQPPGASRTFASFVPPRKSKSFAQHPVAASIVKPLAGISPNVVTFWGIGSPESDFDLLEIYKMHCDRADRVEFINPSENDAKRMEHQLGRSVIHYKDAKLWIAKAT